MAGPKPGATKPDMKDVSRQPSTYMLGVSEQVASMADVMLIVQGTELPVHTYILAANSPVFANMLMLEATSTAPSKSKPLHTIPLEGDSLPIVCTALRYMYLWSMVVIPSTPAIQSCEDAAALVTFAHKYSMTRVLDKAEGHLVAEACKDKGKVLFDDPAQLVAWVKLAETCKLDVFLAHVERFMIQHMDISFCQSELAGSDGISQQCSLRVLRGALHGRQEAVKSVVRQKELASRITGARLCSYCNKYCNGNCEPVKSLKVDIDTLDVSITTLTEWHKQDS